jgi:rRNA-processing protein FCF1
MQIASVTLSVASREKFEVINKVALTKELVELKFPEMAIFGFLDIVMIVDSLDVTSIRIAIENVVVDPIETTAFAIREAGRDAARKLLQALKLPSNLVSLQRN